MNIDTNINNILANRIKQHIKEADAPCSSWVYSRDARILQYMQINQHAILAN